MAKKTPPKALKQASTADDSSAKGTQPDPVKLNPYDGAAVRGALDDGAREAVISSGYDEDVSVSNVKIIVGLIAIALALYAQFGPGKFPGTWWTVLACVASYTVLSLALHWYSWTYEGDAFLLTKPRPGQPHGLRVSSKLGRYDDKYTLTIAEGKPGYVGKKASSTWSITAFFHEDGYLADAALRDEVVKLVEALEAQQQGGSKKDN